MKYLTAFLLVLVPLVVPAQIPDLLSYRSTIIGKDSLPYGNKEIVVEVSIRNSERDNANIEYLEIHRLVTNNIGGYHLNIGDGQLDSRFEGLKDVDWSIGEKYLHISVFDTNARLLSSGTSQLMSVPYALYAKEVESDESNEASINVNSLDLLRAITTYSHGDLVYVKGHTILGDGGQGYFMFNENYNYPDNGGDDKGIIIKPINITDPSTGGRWLRLFDGYINVNYYGITNLTNPDPTINYVSDRIQLIIDYAAANVNGESLYPELTKGNTIYFPNGEYFIDKPLILKTGISIIGEGDNTLFTAAPNANYDYMFKNFDSANINEYGGVFTIHMEKFRINGRYCVEDPKNPEACNEPAYVGGIHFRAISDGDTGGFQRSKLKNIFIVNMWGHGIYLRGGANNGAGSNYRLPNQYNVFENIIINRETDNGNCLLMEGQHSENIFIRCAFSGSRKTPLSTPNVILNNTIGGAEEFGASNQDLFLNCGFGISEYGVVIRESENITFESCWFEALFTAIKLESANRINIQNSRFANAAGYGSENPGGIYPISSDDLYGECVEVFESSVNIDRNWIEVTSPQNVDPESMFIRGRSTSSTANNTINVNDNSFQNPILANTFGILQYATLFSNTIEIDDKKQIFVNYDSSNNSLRTIKSTVNGGEVIYIRANRQDLIGNLTIYAYTSQPGENIYLAGQPSITLSNGEWASFIKVDNPIGNGERSTFQLLNKSK